MGFTIDEYTKRINSLGDSKLDSNLHNTLNSVLSVDYDLTNLYYIHKIGLGVHIQDLWSELYKKNGMKGDLTNKIIGSFNIKDSNSKDSGPLKSAFAKSVERARNSCIANSSWEYFSPLLIESVSLGSLNYSTNRQWIGNQWSIASGRPEISIVSITFRDIGAGALYEMFRNYYVWAHKQYPDDTKCNLVISKLSTNAFIREYSSDVPRKVYPMLATTQAFLEGISLPNLNSGSKALSTFTCNFSYDPTVV